MAPARTLYDKLVDAHTVRRLDRRQGPGAQLLLYVDRTVVNEYTSPQAFSGLRDSKRTMWRPEATLGVIDHVIPTWPQRVSRMADPDAQLQADYLQRNSQDFGFELHGALDPMQGVEHVVLPELGFVLPGMVVAAGDSHTTTYGALGALSFGIGTSDIEHYLATQTLVYRRLRNMRVTLRGVLPLGVTAKDVVMALIAKIGAGGATGHAVEFAGDGLAALSVEGRMTICNMALESGARGVVMRPDHAVLAYLRDRPRVPTGDLWDRAVRYWRSLHSDPRARFHNEVTLNADEIEPLVTWGTSPDQSVPIGEKVPDPGDEADWNRRRDMEKALHYMGLRPGTAMQSVKIDRAFIGSCTNGRMSDLREVARVVHGRRVADGVRAMIVPGSSQVRREAEAEGLDKVFADAGFEWRQSGCSMCLAMNDDVLGPQERCASSTNRNFEGRQGAGGRTHLMSPAMVAAAAITGRLTDVRRLHRG